MSELSMVIIFLKYLMVCPYGFLYADSGTRTQVLLKARFKLTNKLKIFQYRYFTVFNISQFLHSKHKSFKVI